MRIGQLCKCTGLSRDTVRFYEREGLIVSAPSDSATNSYRKYGDDLPERLAMIGQARDAGMSISDLKMLLGHLESGSPENLDVNAFLDDRIDQIETMILQAGRFLKVLKMTRDALVVDANPKP